MIPIFDGARGQEINARNPRGMGGNIQIRSASLGDHVFSLDSLESTYIDEANPSTNYNASTTLRKAYYDTAGGTGDERQIVVQFPVYIPRTFYILFSTLNSVVRSFYNGVGSSNTATTRLRIDVTCIASFGSLTIDTITWNNKAGLTLGNSNINNLMLATGNSPTAANVTENASRETAAAGILGLHSADGSNPPVGVLIGINHVTIGQDAPNAKYQKTFEVDSSNTLGGGTWGSRPMWVVFDNQG